MYHHQNGLTVGKAAKATVIAALSIWVKARFHAHFLPSMWIQVFATKISYMYIYSSCGCVRLSAGKSCY